MVKKRPSEINQLNGLVLERSAEAGVRVPVTASIVEAMLAVDAGELRPGVDNIDMVLSRAGY